MPAPLNEAIIYHGGGCYDGFTAAWVAHKVWPDADFYPMLHNDPLPDLTGREVVLLDITFPLPVMEALCQSVGGRVRIIDHHHTSFVTLSSMLGEDWSGNSCVDVCSPKFTAQLDKNRSGAGLVWDLLVGTKRPSLINYVEDMDLGRLLYGEDTRDFHCALTTFPQTFEVWDAVDKRPLSKLLTMGAPIREARMNLARNICSRARPIRMWGDGCSWQVWSVNAPLELIFEVNEVLSTARVEGLRLPVLAWFWDGKRGVTQYSLRSWEDGPDVEKMASMYGGGGHKSAAGFTHEFDPENLLAESGR